MKKEGMHQVHPAPHHQVVSDSPSLPLLPTIDLLQFPNWLVDPTGWSLFGEAADYVKTGEISNLSEQSEELTLSRSSSRRRRLRRRRSKRAQRYRHFKHISVLGRMKNVCSGGSSNLGREPYVLEWLKENPPWNMDEAFKYKAIPSDLSAQIEHLNHYDRPMVRPFCSLSMNVATRRMRERMQYLRSKLNIRMSDLRIEDIDVPWSSHPGIGYGPDAKKGDESIRTACFLNARVALDQLFEGLWVPPRIAQAGGRAALRLVDGVQKVKKGRLVWNVAFRDFLICAFTAQTITKMVGEDPIMCTGLGLSYAHKGVIEQLFDRIGGYKNYEDIDLPRYDSSISPEYTASLIAMVRTLFIDDSPIYDTYWEFVYHSVAKRAILMQDGTVLQPHVGMASGNPFVPVLESLLSVIVAESFCLSAMANGGEDILKYSSPFVFKPFTVCCSGDNMTIGHNIDKRYLNFPHLRKEVDLYFNVELTEDKHSTSKSFFTDVDPHGRMVSEGCKYLSKRFYGYLPYRTYVETTSILLNPEYGISNPFWSFLRAYGLWFDNPANESVLDLLEDFMRWLQHKYKVLDQPNTYLMSPDILYMTGVGKEIIHELTSGYLDIPHKSKDILSVFLSAATSPPKGWGGVCEESWCV